MEIKLRQMSEAEIFKPGDLYIFHESKYPGSDPGPIEYMYFIRSEGEILPALKMEVEQILAYQFRNLLGCVEVSDSCYEFRLECYDPEKGNIQYSLYLHRIRTVQEALLDAERLFSNRD